MNIDNKTIWVITILLSILNALTVMLFYKVTDDILVYSIIVIAIITYMIFLTLGVSKNNNDYIKGYKSFIEVMMVVNFIMAVMFLVDIKFLKVSIVSIIMLLLEIIVFKLLKTETTNKNID